MWIQPNIMPTFTLIVDPVLVLEVKFSSLKTENNLTATTKVMKCEIISPLLLWKYTPRVLREILTSSISVI